MEPFTVNGQQFNKKRFFSLAIQIMKLAPYVAAILIAFWAEINLMLMPENEKTEQYFLEILLWILSFLAITVLIDKIDSFREIMAEIRVSKGDIEKKIEYEASLSLESLGHTQRRLNEILHRTYDTYLNVVMHEYDDKWVKWRQDLTRDAAESEGVLNYSWKELMEAYLKEQIDWVTRKMVKTTSEMYTQMVSSVSKFLYKEFIAETKDFYLYRYHITGMLPEEFFNGPQIEYTTLDYTPVIFCHRFEDERYINSHYRIIDDKKELERMDVKRCILVREATLIDEKFSALSTFQALSNQMGLSIHKGGAKPVTILGSHDFHGAIDRLFVHCTHKVHEYVAQSKMSKAQFIHEIIDSNNYRFFPITATAQVKDKEDAGNFEDLIQYFARYFNREIGDIYYYCIDENDEERARLQRIFRKGGWPEITLFGIRHKGESRPKNWIFGIRGHYTPFTREIEIQILTPDEANLIAHELHPIMGSRKLDDLRTLAVTKEIRNHSF